MAGDRPRHRAGIGIGRVDRIDEDRGGRCGGGGGLLVGPDHGDEAAELVVAVADDLAIFVGRRGDLAEPEVVGRGRDIGPALSGCEVVGDRCGRWCRSRR